MAKKLDCLVMNTNKIKKFWINDDRWTKFFQLKNLSRFGPKFYIRFLVAFLFFITVLVKTMKFF
jgi:hypothetical protein